jgi:PPP family 3-phenylpropionic acid transporter
MKQTTLLLSPLLGAYYFFYFALVGIYVIFMPKVLLDLGYNPLEVGIIYAAAPFMRFLLPFVFRHAISLSPKVYQLSLLFTFLGTLLFLATVNDFWVYLAANLLFGAAMGISLPYVETIALAALPKHRYGKVRLWGSLGFMGIALWLGKVLSSPYEALYYLSAMAFLTLIFGAMLTKHDTVSHSTAQEDASFSLSKYWAFWVSIFLMQVGFGGFYNFFTIYETAHGISLEMISWMWSFGVICEIAICYPCYRTQMDDTLPLPRLGCTHLCITISACYQFCTLPYCSHHLRFFTLYAEKACTTVFPGYRIWVRWFSRCCTFRSDLWRISFPG